MGEGQLPRHRTAALSALALLLAAAAAAQGPVYRERWSYLHLEARRAEVRRELAGRDAATVAKVAELLAGPDQGVPFRPVAAALALLRGVPADPRFLLRTMVTAFVLPEVVDPVGAVEECRVANVSLHLPYAVPLPGAVGFVVQVVDAAGAPVFTTTLAGPHPLEDLRLAQVTARVPGENLADGRYELRVQTLVDGAAPAAAEPQLRWSFAVRRGYQAHAAAALRRTAELAPRLPPLPQALLQGLHAPVARAFAGEAFDVASAALDDLDRLQRGQQNAAAGRPILAGLDGDVLAALPTGAGPLAAVLRLVRGDDGAIAVRPTVVFASGCPAYDLEARRPTGPASRSPRWTAAELAGFGRDERWHLVCLESPGGGGNYGQQVADALGALRELLGQGPMVLVAEREAAAAAAFRATALQQQLRGLAVLGSGAMPGAMLDRLAGLPVRVGFVHGHPGNEGLQRMLDYAAGRATAGGPAPDVQAWAGAAPPWPFALPAYAGEVRAFVAALTR